MTINVYLAGGWFDKFQIEALDYLEEFLSKQDKFKVFAPRKEVKLDGIEAADKMQEVFNINCKHIEEADLVIASTVSKDMGTIWECGYAAKCGKPLIYTLFDKRFPDVIFNLMLAKSGIATFIDKKDFEKFVALISKENVNSISKDYEGDFI